MLRQETTPDMMNEDLIEALGLIHYYQIKTRRNSMVWRLVTIVLAILVTSVFSWWIGVLIIAISAILSLFRSKKIAEEIQRKTGLDAGAQYALLQKFPLP